jgi:molybdopterin molybdotransferase
LDGHIARAEGADVLVTIGGASVGDHDLVGPVLERRGMVLSFWRIAMRPGKPLLFGRLAGARVLGLPGNPVSAIVCTRIFLVPLIAALLGRSPVAQPPGLARAAVDLAPNGARQHYMRARLSAGPDGVREVTPLAVQDSAYLRPLAEADCLLVRPVGAPLTPAGSLVPILPLEGAD